MPRITTLVLLILLVCVSFTPGCVPERSAAEVETFKAIAPEYIEMVQESKLSEFDKKIRYRLVYSWGQRLGQKTDFLPKEEPQPKKRE